ncbi:unnamed protein product [Discula destructiva]
MSDMVQKAPEATQIADTGAWLAYFNDEIHDYEEGTADRDFPELFKSLLNAGSTDDLALNDYLRRFDELDRKSSLTYEPLVGIHGKRVMMQNTDDYRKRF